MKLLKLSILGLAFSTAVSATEITDLTIAQQDKVALNLAKNFSKGAESIKKESFNIVGELKVGGSLYMVEKDGEYFLTNEAGAIVFSGDMLDFEEEKNIKTEAIKKVVKPMHESLGNEQYVSYKPDGEIRDILWLYSDLNCGYCKKFHKQIPGLNKAGVEVRVIPFVRGLRTSKLNESNYKNTVGIFSESNQEKRLELYKRKLKGEKLTLSNNTKHGEKIVENGYELGLKTGLTGTPTLVNSAGLSYSGLLPNEVIINNFLTAK